MSVCYCNTRLVDGRCIHTQPPCTDPAHADLERRLKEATEDHLRVRDECFAAHAASMDLAGKLASADQRAQKAETDVLIVETRRKNAMDLLAAAEQRAREVAGEIRRACAEASDAGTTWDAWKALHASMCALASRLLPEPPAEKKMRWWVMRHPVETERVAGNAHALIVGPCAPDDRYIEVVPAAKESA